MASEISGLLRFEHLLSHTFPGFFSAGTLFMLVDLLSPSDLTAYATKNVDGLIGFVGFVILVGTIIGVIIDGIHHMIIEKDIFDNFIGIRELDEIQSSLYPQADIEIVRPYFFKTVRGLEIDEYMTSKIYRYSEFHSNTFIALIPFSVIAPFYLLSVFQIPLNYSFLLCFMTLFVACACLKESYYLYKGYVKWVISALCGYLNYDSFIHIEPKNYGNSKFEVKLEATIINKEIQNRFKEVNFKTTLGHFKTTTGNDFPKITTSTDQYGKAEATLILDQDCVYNGIAIVTATSDKCIPGFSKIPKDQRVCINLQTYLKKNLCMTITNTIMVFAVAIATTEIFGLSLCNFAVIFLLGISVGTAICCLTKDYLVDENVDKKISIVEKIRKCQSQNAFGISMTLLITLFFALATLSFCIPSK